MKDRGLHLQLKEGALTSIAQTFGDEHYVVHRANPAFDFFWHLVLSLSAMNLALSSVFNEPVKKGDYILLPGIGFDYTVRVPGHGGVDAVLNGIVAHGMIVTIHWGRNKSSGNAWETNVPLKRWLELLLWPGFVHLFQSHETRIGKHAGEAGRLARLLRDAYAHGGKITNSKSCIEASWGGVTIGRADDGRPVSEFVGGSDLIVLALKLSSLIA